MNNTIPAICRSILIMVGLSAQLHAQQYTPAEKGCKVEFRVGYKKDGNHVVKGAFSNLKGKIVFNPGKLSTASFDITVSAGSINTAMAERDKGLKKAPYFNPAKYPLIHIKSTGVTQDKPGGIIYTLHGNLTMNGITKPVNILFTASPMGAGYIFRGALDVNRLDYNIGTKGDGIDNVVSVFIEARANKK